MRLSEILAEGYDAELDDTVQSILVRLMTKDETSISTPDFIHLLAQEGYVVTSNEVINILGQPDMQSFVSSVSAEKISFANTMGDDMDMGADAATDVGAMANDQAMSDINSELPQ